MTDARDRIKRLEIERRRPDAAHPDLCQKLHFDGVAFAVAGRGVRVRPCFDGDGRATVGVVDGRGDRELAGLVDRLARATRRRHLTVAPGAGANVLADLMTLARKILLTQYDLTDAELADLLSFEADQRPEWIGDLIRWLDGGGARRSRRRVWRKR